MLYAWSLCPRACAWNLCLRICAWSLCPTVCAWNQCPRTCAGKENSDSGSPERRDYVTLFLGPHTEEGDSAVLQPAFLWGKTVVLLALYHSIFLSNDVDCADEAVAIFLFIYGVFLRFHILTSLSVGDNPHHWTVGAVSTDTLEAHSGALIGSS